MKKHLLSAGLILCFILAGCQENQERITQINTDAVKLISERIDVSILPQVHVPVMDEETNEETGEGTDKGMHGDRPTNENDSAMEELALLQQTLHSVVNQWQDAQETISFTIQELNGEDIEYEGKFAAQDEWELTGTTEEGPEFVLKSVADGVQLEFDGEEELLSTEEFTFLFPEEHVNIAQEVIRNENFESLSWKKEEQAAVIGIRTTAAMLEESFRKYLGEHLDLRQYGMSLQGYGLEYGLVVDTSSEVWVLQELEFILQKDGSFLEHLHYTFQ